MAKPKSPKKTLADLHAIHDRNVVIPNRIRAGLELMTDDWMYEQDFVTLAKVSNTDISRFRDQFVEFWAATAGTNGKTTVRRVWFANKKLATAWKEKIGA